MPQSLNSIARRSLYRFHEPRRNICAAPPLRYNPASAMKRTLISLLTLAFFVSAQAAGQNASPLAEGIQRILNRPEFRHANFGIEFYDLERHEPIYALDTDKLFTPASTTKLLTEGTALALLGADYRFHTRVYRTGPVINGVLNGDLILVASGDPNLSGRIQPNGTLVFENEDHSYAG